MYHYYTLISSDPTQHRNLFEVQDVPPILDLVTHMFPSATTGWTTKKAKEVYGGEVRMTIASSFGLRLPGGVKHLRADRILGFSIKALSRTFVQQTPFLWDLFTHLLNVDPTRKEANADKLALNAETILTATPSGDESNSYSDSGSGSDGSGGNGDDGAGERLEYQGGSAKSNGVSRRRRLIPVVSIFP